MIDRRIVKYKLRRGTESQRPNIVFDEGELVYITDTQKVYVGTGYVSGGVLLNNSIRYLTAAPTQTTPNDLVYRNDLKKSYIFDAANTGVYIGPYTDNTTIEFNTNNELSIASGGVGNEQINATIIDANSGLGIGLSGLYVNYDPATLYIDPSNRLSVVPGIGSALDPYGGLQARPLGVAINTDDETVEVDSGTNELQVKSISAQHIAASSINVTKLSADVVKPNEGLILDASGLAVDYDSTTIHISGGKLAVNMSSIPSVPTGGIVPTATVIHVATITPPAGYLACDGAAVSRSTYATLYAAIGTTFGSGDGTTTFNVPDLRGYFVRGFGTNSDGTTSDTFGTKQADELKSHNHTYNIVATNRRAHAAFDTQSMYGVGNTNTGSTGGTETRPRNIALLACIKT